MGKNHLFFVIKQVIRILKSELTKKKSDYEIGIKIASFVNEYLSTNSSLDDNNKTLIICCIITQIKLHKVDCLDLLLSNIDTDLFNADYREYFKTIVEMLSCLEYSNRFQFCENIDGWYNHISPYISDEDTYEEYHDNRNTAIRNFPELEFAYCFILAEYVSIFGADIKNNNGNEISKLIKDAQKYLSKELFMFCLGGNIEFTDFETNQIKKCQQGEFEVDGQDYFIGIPFTLCLSAEEKNNYYDKTFIEVPISEISQDKLAAYDSYDNETALLYKSSYRFIAWHLFMPNFYSMPLSFKLMEYIAGENIYKLLNQYNINENSYSEIVKVLNSINKIRNSNQDPTLSEEEQINNIFSSYDEMIKSIYIDNSLKNEIENRIKKYFGIENWKKINPEAQNMLISGEITYNTLKNIPDIDYSAAVIPLTKALENILNETIYKKTIYKELVKYADPVINKRTKATEYIISKNNRCIALNNSFIYNDDGNHYIRKNGLIKESLELGSCRFMLEIVMKNLQSYSQGIFKVNYSQYLEGVKDIKELIELILYIANNYRNTAAHKDGVDKVKLESCRNDILITKKVIKNILSILC